MGGCLQAAVDIGLIETLTPKVHRGLRIFRGGDARLRRKALLQPACPAVPPAPRRAFAESPFLRSPDSRASTEMLRSAHYRSLLLTSSLYICLPTASALSYAPYSISFCESWLPPYPCDRASLPPPTSRKMRAGTWFRARTPRSYGNPRQYASQSRPAYSRVVHQRFPAHCHPVHIYHIANGRETFHPIYAKSNRLL